MAKLSAHGHEVGRFYGLTTAKAYMSDGAVLSHDGFSWRLLGKLKEGVTPQEAVAARKARDEEKDRTHPCYTSYKRKLHKMAPQAKRWVLHRAVVVSYHDPDGVWSEITDGYDQAQKVDCGIDEIQMLCRLYRAALEEQKEISRGETS